MTSIHRIILRRLVLAWLTVSIVAGGLGYYIQAGIFNDAIIALAAERASDFAQNGLDDDDKSPEALKALRERAESFVNHHFVAIRITDTQGRSILDIKNPEHLLIGEKMEPFRKKFAPDAKRHFHQFTLGNDIIIQTVLPLPDKRGATKSIFEGFFVVDRSMIEQFRSSLRELLITVLAAVLITTLALYPVIIGLNRDVLRFSHDVLKGNLEMASVLGAAIAKRDHDTGEHNFRVTLYAIHLGKACGLHALDMRHLIIGAFLHDVGKIGIRDNILLKPGPLSDEEFAIMRTHVTLGVDIVRQSEWLRGARQVIESHHERFDGSGYPHALKGEAIPLAARIFAIVDVFDALTSHRPYKEALPLDQSLALLKQGAGSHFDPKLLARFIRMAPALHARINLASEQQLESRLRKQAAHYFLHASLSTKAAQSRQPTLL